MACLVFSVHAVKCLYHLHRLISPVGNFMQIFHNLWPHISDIAVFAALSVCIKWRSNCIFFLQLLHFSPVVFDIQFYVKNGLAPCLSGSLWFVVL